MKKLLLILILSTGCSLNADYVQADKETYEAFSPKIEEWIESDASLDADEKDDYRGLKRSWHARVQAALEYTKDD